MKINNYNEYQAWLKPHTQFVVQSLDNNEEYLGQSTTLAGALEIAREYASKSIYDAVIKDRSGKIICFSNGIIPECHGGMDASRGTVEYNSL